MVCRIYRKVLHVIVVVVGWNFILVCYNFSRTKK